MLKELRGGATALALATCAVLAVIGLRLDLPGAELLQSLRFHIGAVLLGLVLVFLFSRSWWRAVVFALVAFASIGQGGAVIYSQQSARAFPGAEAATPLLKLVSFNTLQGNVSNGERIADFLIGSGADLVMVMEAGPIEAQATKLRATYPYAAGCLGVDGCDTVLLSKTPLEDAVVRSLSRVWRNRLIIAKTTIAGQAIDVVVAHMVKPYFDEFAVEEAYQLWSAIKALEGPVLLAGDFNAAAWSPNVDWIRREAGLVPPPFYPATWPIRLGPLGVPIDNVWTRPPLIVTHVEAMADSMGSNHRGLISEVAIAASP